MTAGGGIAGNAPEGVSPALAEIVTPTAGRVLTLAPGDSIRIETPGGGGFGAL